jgi:uncharacterized membrane protein
MGIIKSLIECPHAVTDHKTCKVILENQLAGTVAMKDFSIITLALFGVVFIVSIFFKKALNVSLVKQNQNPFYIELLFSSGILNPKAP